MIEVKENDFQNQVINSGIPVLVDFWAPWCGPCKMLEPTLESLDKELSGKLKIARINVEDNPALATQFQILSIPALLLFKQGKIVSQVVGARPKEEIIATLNPHLK
jgi:thioredoxin 1